MLMETIFNTQEINPHQNDLPEEIVGFNFYTLLGELVGNYKKGLHAYPKCNMKVLVKIKGNEIEMPNNSSLIKLGEEYAILRKIK